MNESHPQFKAGIDPRGVIVIQSLFFLLWATGNVSEAVDTIRQMSSAGSNWLPWASIACFAGGALVGFLVFFLARTSRWRGVSALLLLIAFPALMIAIMTTINLIGSPTARQVGSVLSQLTLGGSFLGQPIGVYLGWRREQSK